MEGAFFSLKKMFFLRLARHPADTDGRSTGGAQVLARLPMVPWHPYHSGPAQHCIAECRFALGAVHLRKPKGIFL